MWKDGPARLLDHWQAGGIVTAQTGSPFTVVLAGGTSSAAAAFGNPARLNLISSSFQTSAGCPGPFRTLQSRFNLGGSNFGKVLSANAYGNKPPRQIQLSARVTF